MRGHVFAARLSVSEGVVAVNAVRGIDAVRLTLKSIKEE